MLKKILLRNFVVCACAGTLMAGMPGELLAKPASSDYQQIIECPVDFASGKGSIKVFQNMENDAEAVYYLPTRFELAREKDKDSGLVLPLLSLRITQRKSPKSGELEEFADLKGTFDISLSEMVREKIKKLVKDNSGLDIAKVKILPLPVKKVTAILYTSSGKKICEMPTSVIGNFKGTQFVVAGRLDNQQSLMVEKEAVSVIFQVEYQGKIRPMPFQLTYDNEEVLKLLKTKKNRQALLDVLLAPDKKSLDAFDHAFMKSKALVWQDLKSDPRFAQRSEKLDMQNLRKPQLMNLDQQPSARVAAMTLFDRLRSQISLKLPENLPAEKMPTIESSIEKVFAEFVELQLPEKADPVGKVEIQFTRVSAGEFIWAGAGSFDLSSMADATKEKIVTYTPPELYTIASLILPGIGFDNSLFIKELVMEVTAMDAKNHKIAGPLTATFNSSDGTWQDKAGKPCQQLIMDLKDHYDKDKAKLPEGNFKFLTRVTQDIQGKDWTVETIQTGPLFLGEGPLPNPMSSLDTLYVNFDFLTFGEDLKEVKVELNLASAKKKIELSVDADTEPLNFAVLIGRVPENEGEKVRREKIAAEIHFITRTGKIDKKIEDIFADGDSLELYDDMYVEP